MNTDKIYAESIASEYSVKNDAKVVALRKLDKKVKDFPLIFSFVLGVISTLVLGTGMSLTMGVIGNETEGSFIDVYKRQVQFNNTLFCFSYSHAMLVIFHSNDSFFSKLPSGFPSADDGRCCTVRPA